MRKIIFAAVMIAVMSLSAAAFAGQIVMDGSTYGASLWTSCRGAVFKAEPRCKVLSFRYRYRERIQVPCRRQRADRERLQVYKGFGNQIMHG